MWHREIVIQRYAEWLWLLVDTHRGLENANIDLPSNVNMCRSKARNECFRRSANGTPQAYGKEGFDEQKSIKWQA